MIARCDRIELSKNIVRGFLAYDRLLEARPGLRGRVVFVAMLYPSRQGLASYLAYASEIEQVVARVNDRWATRDWTPIVLDQRDDFPRSVAAMQRYDVLLVNPIKDGLNLVAKEGPAVNRRDGVLCLSPEAGAYDELRKAVLPIHPYDIEAAAGTLDHALAIAARRAGDHRDAAADARRPRAIPRSGSPISSRTRPSTHELTRASRSTSRVEQHSQARGSVDETVDRAGQRRRASRSTRTPIRTARASRPSACGATERGERRRDHRCRRPRTPRPRYPSIERVDRGALVDRDRRAQLDREPASRNSREAVAAGEIGGDRQRPRAARSGAVRQCSVTLTPDLALDDHAGQPRVGLVGGGRDRVAVRERPEDRRAVHRRRPSPSRRDRPRRARARRPGSTRNSIGSPAHDPDPADPARPAARSASIAAGKRDRIVGPIDDRRERTVVVDEDRRLAPGAR